MRVLIIGGGGMLGVKLAHALAARGTLRGAPIATLGLADLEAPTPIAAPMSVTAHPIDVADANAVSTLIGEGWDVIYHLAAIVSGQAEAEFDLGWSINMMGGWNVFQAARALGTTPVVVFTSSLAVYGGEIPENRADQPIVDWTHLNPQTSYGAQKAACELMLTDFSRKGFLDGRGLRLPTISVRPGAPNKAASGFMSSIFREPLQGQDAVCPVSPEFEHYYLSPRACVTNLIHAAEVPAEAWGQNRCVALPGRTHRIGDMVEALRRIAGDEPVSRIRFERDPEIEKIVLGWKAHVDAAKALRLGFIRDENFEDNIRYFLEDDVRAPT